MATGPVGAGGDQGRDFETFKTYLKQKKLSGFVGIADDNLIVFGCTLQKAKLKSKIKEDVCTICSDGVKPTSIYYFCESNLPVSQRHALKQWATSTYQVELEIIDGATLSEQLSRLDLFWIAQEYLNVPADAFPRPETADSWYSNLRINWLSGGRIITNSEDFFEVKSAIRHATFIESEKPDLPKWILKLEAAIGTPDLEYLQQRAIYEVCVAALRGLNNLSSKVELIHKYYSNIDDFITTSELKDATILLSYCSTALVVEQLAINPVHLHQWTLKLTSKIDELLAGRLSSSQKANLLQVRGHAATLQFAHGTVPKFSHEAALAWWGKALDEAEKSPLFALEDFSRLLCQLAGFFPDNDAVIELSARADELLAKRVGQFAAAHNARELANAFLTAEKYLAAIKQLHRAKEKWYAAETLRGSLIAMLILANAYRALDLLYASKHYASAAAFLAFKADDDKLKRYIADAGFELCLTAFLAGEWLTLVQYASFTCIASQNFKQDELEIESEKLQMLYVQLATILSFAHRFSPEVYAKLVSLLEEASLPNDDKEFIVKLSASEEIALTEKSDSNVWQLAERIVSARPFVDIGETRSLVWQASGINWEIRAKNEFKSVAIAEQVCATLQILVADFASTDLCLYPTSVLIEIEISLIATVQVEEVSDNNRATWVMKVPNTWIDDTVVLEKVDIDVATLAIAILSKCSALKWEAFHSRVDAAFANGLVNKLHSVRPYADLFRNFLSRIQFEHQLGHSFNPILPEEKFHQVEHAELAWRSDSGPGYDHESALRDIENRYVKAVRPMRLTLARWRDNQIFQQFVGRLRSKGFKDWLILLVLSNVVANFRANLIPQQGKALEQIRQTSYEIMHRDEEDSDPEVPISLLEREDIDFQISITLSAVAKTFGLELNQTTPNFFAMRRLLEARYRIHEDDVEHIDPFK